MDRPTLLLPAAQQKLLEAVRKASKAAGGKLVVVVISAGPVVLDPALADGVLFAGYPGEEAGHGLADVIFGRVSPSARVRHNVLHPPPRTHTPCLAMQSAS